MEASVNNGEYAIDPSDGMVARVVHSWAHRKHYFLDQYAGRFAVAMKTAWPRRTYIDLFAGPGRCYEEETDQFFDGSPLRGLRHDFTDFIFVELDDIAADALERRSAIVAPDKRPVVIRGDCNERIGDVLAALPDGIAMAFVDPTNWQVAFDTLAALTANRRVDLLISFFAGSMKRVGHLAEQPRLDDFFGSPAWRDAQYREPNGRHSLSSLLRCYRDRFATIGYFETQAAREVAVKNSKNVTMYLMTFFSKHSLGYKFWDDTTSRDELGQFAFSWGR